MDIRSELEAAGSAPGPGGSWMGVLEALLSYCRDCAAEVRDFGDRDLLEELQMAVRAECRAVLADAGEILVGQELAETLGGIAEAHVNRADRGTAVNAAVARGLAEAVDDELHEAFVGRWHAQGGLEIEEGGLFPVHRYDPTPLIEGSATTRPEHQPQTDMGRLAHLAIAGRWASEYRVVLDWDAHDHLLGLSALVEDGDLRLATCRSNLELSEFDIEPDQDRGVFRNHGPADRDSQIELLRAGIESAVEACASVVVVGEYCVHEGDRDAVASAVDSLDEPPPLVVAGSSRVTEPEEPQNEATLIMAQGGGSLVKRVAKNHRATFEGLEEDIAPAAGREVRVFLSGRWAICVLICFDAMSDDLITALGHVGVNLLVVPAMTPRRTSIVRSLAQLTNRSQAFCVLACVPARFPPGDEEAGRGPDEAPFDAAFDGPYEGAPGALTVPEEGQGDSSDDLERGLWVFGVAAREATWTALTEVVSE